MTGFERFSRRRVSVAAALFAGLALAALARPALSGAPLPLALLLACLALALWLIRDDRLRARLAAEQGAGVVVVKEGRIGYLGPEVGGVADLDALVAVEAERRAGGLVWTLHRSDGPSIAIPAGAEGAEALLDALAPLPGFDAAALAALSGARTRRRAVLYRRPQAGQSIPVLKDAR